MFGNNIVQFSIFYFSFAVFTPPYLNYLSIDISVFRITSADIKNPDNPFKAAVKYFKWKYIICVYLMGFSNNIK